MKKQLTACLIFILLFTLLLPADASTEGKPVLLDMSSHWSRDTVDSLVYREGIGGYPDGTFRPNNDISRAEFVKIIAASLNLSTASGTSFKDTAAHWAKDNIESAVKQGIILPTEYENGYFNPNTPVTREEIAVMLSRTLGLDREEPSDYNLFFTDVEEITLKWFNHIAKTAEKGIIRGYPDGTFRPRAFATRAEASVMIVRMIEIKEQHFYRQYMENIFMNGRSFVTQVIEIKPEAKLKPQFAFAKDLVTGLDSLKTIAEKHGAIAAINGGFYNAYSGAPDPYGSLFLNGEMIHRGQHGSTLGFTRDGNIKIDTLRSSIKGITADGAPWHSYGFNHTPEPSKNGAYIFNSYWGDCLGFDYGKSIIVKNGKVVRITENENVSIPENGFVINLTGWEIVRLGDTFYPGQEGVEYWIEYTNHTGEAVDWSDVVQGLSAGPILVLDGRVVVDPVSEGFETKIMLQDRARRSVIGFKEDGTVLLVNVNLATVFEMAEIVFELGVKDAFCMDGGRSSGLFFQGYYVNTPERHINNALLFIPAN